MDEHMIIKPNNIDSRYECHQLLGIASFKERSEKELNICHMKCTWLERLVKVAPPPHVTIEELDWYGRTWMLGMVGEMLLQAK